MHNLDLNTVGREISPELQAKHVYLKKNPPGIIPT
jgi:hypothetical protein